MHGIREKAGYVFVISLLHRTVTKTDGTKLKININQAYREYKHVLAFRVRRYTHLQCTRLYAYVYVVIATKPMHRLQIRPVVQK